MKSGWETGKRVIHRGGTGELNPVDRDVSQSGFLAIFLDEFLIAHDVEREIVQPELARHAHLLGFGLDGGNPAQRGDHEQEGGREQSKSWHK